MKTEQALAKSRRKSYTRRLELPIAGEVILVKALLVKRRQPVKVADI